MSERLKFEHHPDADQISAFVEQALPSHEREQMLDHLAVCAECRTIVALSLPEIEEPAIEPPAPAQRPWWAGWTLAWPVAGAVAVIAVYFAYVHRVIPAANVPSQQQVAVAHVPVAPGASQQEATPSAQPALRGTVARQTDRSPAASSRGAADAVKRSGEAANAGHAVSGGILTGRDAAELIKLAPPSPPAVEAQKSNDRGAAISNLMSNRSNGVVAGIGQGSGTGQTAGVELGVQGKAATGAAGAPVVLAAPAAPIAAPQAASTVMVASAKQEPTDTVSVNAASIEPAQDDANELSAQLQYPLPSGLSALSIAVRGRSMVAIDTRSAVFASNDAGMHWKAIHAPWQGRAVKAALVGLPAGSASGMSLSRQAGVGGLQDNKKESPRAAVGALVAPAPAPSAAQGGSLSGVVTDQTGAAISGATVIVTETATGTAHRVQTDGAGRYLVDGLAPGTCQVEARALGFKENTISGVAVAGPGRSVANLTLIVSASSQTVTVIGADVAVPVSGRSLKKARAAIQTDPIFEITTDNGERWTSIDGVTWKRM